MNLDKLIKILKDIRKEEGNIPVSVGCFADEFGASHDNSLEHILVSKYGKVNLLSSCDHMEEIL